MADAFEALFAAWRVTVLALGLLLAAHASDAFRDLGSLINVLGYPDPGIEGAVGNG